MLIIQETGSINGRYREIFKKSLSSNHTFYECFNSYELNSTDVDFILFHAYEDEISTITSIKSLVLHMKPILIVMDGLLFTKATVDNMLQLMEEVKTPIFLIHPELLNLNFTKSEYLSINHVSEHRDSLTLGLLNVLSILLSYKSSVVTKISMNGNSSKDYIDSYVFCEFFNGHKVSIHATTFTSGSADITELMNEDNFKLLIAKELVFTNDIIRSIAMGYEMSNSTYKREYGMLGFDFYLEACKIVHQWQERFVK